MCTLQRVLEKSVLSILDLMEKEKDIETGRVIQ
jgi:hypothetical protein